MNRKLQEEKLINHQTLEKELEELKCRFKMGHELKTSWLPGQIKHSKGRELRGEVLGSTIFVYDQDYEGAKETLRHEFLEYLIEQPIEPYRKLLNALISIFEQMSYEAKEELVKALVKVL